MNTKKIDVQTKRLLDLDIDPVWFKKELEKDKQEKIKIKNGTHKHTYKDPDCIVFNPNIHYYQRVCDDCGKIKGTHNKYWYDKNLRKRN